MSDRGERSVERKGMREKEKKSVVKAVGDLG